MKVFLKIKDDNIYLYSNDIVRLAEYTKKLNRNGYICEVITKSSL
jgi:hypothetical protein